MPGSDSEFFVGWGTLALINANLAQLRGRGPVRGFLGSPLAGPIVTLAPILTHVEPDPPPPPRPRDGASTPGAS